MKILQIHNQYKYKGGEDTTVEDEKNLLKKNNCKVFQLIRSNKNEINSLLQYINVGKNLIYSKISKEIVIKAIKKINPDIIHIHNTFPLWTFSILDACNEMKVPTVMTLQNFRLICSKGTFYRDNKICELCITSSPFNAVKYGCYQNSRIKSLPISLMIKKNNKGLSLLDKLNKIIVVSKFNKKKFLEANFPENKIVIKPNFFLNNLNVRPSIKKKGFLYASRLSEEKGILDLINAYNKFNFDLKICGDGNLKNKIINIKNINYLGFLNKSKLYEEINKSKFLVFPSKWYEGFPKIILEAFALGTIVIAPNLGTMSCIIKDKFNGILFKPNDIDDLVKKIKWVLNNDNKCKIIKINAKKDLLKKYSEKSNFKELINIYETAIKENKNNKLFY